MKLLISIFFSLLTVTSENPDVNRLRNLYEEALNNNDKAEELISYIDKTKITPLAIGYKGSAVMLLAKHSYNPFSKYRYFNEGKSFLEEAIRLDSTSFELIYLRFSVQTNCRSFLSYNTCIQKDKLFLINALNNIYDSGLKNKIISVLKNSKYVSENEKQKI